MVTAVALLALVPSGLRQAPASYPLRVNVAERQEFDYDLTLPGRPRPIRLLYTVQRVSKRDEGKGVLWQVQQYDRDADGHTADRPMTVSMVELDDRNNPIKGKSKTLVDESSFGASDEARRVGRLVLGALNFNFPKTPVFVGRTWGARVENPFVKNATFQVDYKLVEETTIHSWDCYRIELAASLSAGYGGREIGLDGVSYVERSTGMPVSVDLRVTGADAVSESLNRNFRLHLTRDKDEK